MGVGGTETYVRASDGETCTPAAWYLLEDSTAVYCATCAAKLTEEDPTRSVSQFYSDTAGNEIVHENPPDFV
jgi:hypothetical protein